MKIKSIEIKEHPILKNLTLDFTYEGKVLDTVVIAGGNGSGKTSLLNYIYEYFKNIAEETPIREKINIDYLSLNEETFIFDGSFKDIEIPKGNGCPKIIYLPAEIEFQNLETKTNSYKQEYSFLNYIDRYLVENIPSYIATKINMEANISEDLTMKEVREKVSKEINDIFEILELDIKMVGLTKDERSLPLFKNSFGDEFDINQLSSGEKQLFIRALTLKMLKAENSIILIDEPEISLHPKWQQKILKVYERIGKNNQIIAATHSPHILSAVEEESIFIFQKNQENRCIEVKRGNELSLAYGQPVQKILQGVMGLETVRDPEVYGKILELRKMVDEDLYETQEFKEKYQKLKKILGNFDEDLLLISMDIARKAGKKVHQDA